MRNFIYLMAFFTLSATIFSSCMKEEMIHYESLETTNEVEAMQPLGYMAKGGDVLTPADLDITLNTSIFTAGQHHNAGTIITGIYTDPVTGEHFVTIFVDMTHSGWAAGTTHIYVGGGGGGAIPLNGGGNPSPGQFPYGSGDLNINDILNDMNAGNYNGMDVYTFPLSDVSTTNDDGQVCFTVMVHAEVYEIDGEAGSSTDPLTVVGSETAWEDGSAISDIGCDQLGNKKGKGGCGGNGGGSWAMYNTYCL